MIQLPYKDVGDAQARRCFEILQDALKGIAILAGRFELVEITFTAAKANFKHPHHRGFVPKDVLQLRITGTGTLTWNYALFDRNFLDITVTGPCVVRAFIGSCGEVTP